MYMYTIISAIVFILVLFILSAFLGFFSRVLKFIFRRDEISIDKGFLTLFSILSVIVIAVKGIGILIRAVHVFNGYGHFGWKVLYFIVNQIFVSLLVSFSASIFYFIILVFIKTSGSLLEEDKFFDLLTIPLFILNIYHSIPIFAVIIAVIF